MHWPRRAVCYVVQQIEKIIDMKNKLFHRAMFPGIYGCVYKYNTDIKPFLTFISLEKGSRDKDIRGEQTVDVTAGLEDTTTKIEKGEEETQNQSQTQYRPDAVEEREPTNYDGMLQTLHKQTELKLAVYIVNFYIICFISSK